MKYLLLIIPIAIALISCKEETDCLSYSSNTGIIVKEPNMGKCFSVMVEDSYLITDSASYAQLHSSTFDSIQADLGCADNPSRPEIDFSANYLIGAKTLAKGCIVSYSRNVSYLSSLRILNYTIDVHQCGECNDSRYDMNWVLIQKTDTIDSLNLDINYYIESN